MAKITYGILTFNRKKEVLRAIDSAYRQKGLDNYESEIVMVDAASVDGTAKTVAEKYPDVKIIKLPYNIGCPSGRNYIYANSTGDFIINIDDDGYLEDDAAKLIVDTFESDDRIGVVAIKQLFIGTDKDGVAVSDQKSDVSLFRGGLSAFRTSALKEAGYYPDDYFMYCEEDYLTLKFLDKGYRIVCEPDSAMWHPEIGSSRTNKKLEYYKYRNSMQNVIRLYPMSYLLKYLPKRLVAELRTSIMQGCVLQYIKASVEVLCTLPQTLANRNACKKETVKLYFDLRKKK